MGSELNRSQTTLVVIDDHTVVREGLARMLSEYEDIEIIGAASTGLEGLALVEKARPEVVLLDLSLPDVNGLDVLPRIVQLVPESRVLVLTIHDQPGLAGQALRAGAAGYVLKDTSQTELVSAIRAVAVGGEYFDQCVLSWLFGDGVADESSSQLSPREIEVVRLLADGLSNRQIGEALRLGTETVKSHVSTIFRKLDVSDRAQAVSRALRTGLIT